MYRVKRLFLIIFLFQFVYQVKLIKKIDTIKNDKFLDYGVEFVPLNLPNLNYNLNSLSYPLIKSKSLSISDSSNLEKRKQREIIVKLIDSIQFNSANDHQIGKLNSADQISQIANKYPKIDLSTYGLFFLGEKKIQDKKFNHYIIIKKKVKKSNEYQLNRNNLNLDNSLFYTYQNIPSLNRNANRKNYNHYNLLLQNHQSKSLNDDNNYDQFVFSSVFIQKGVFFGIKAIRIAFYQSLKLNLNNEENLSKTKVHNIWLANSTRFKTSSLIPLERIHTLSGVSMLYKN